MEALKTGLLPPESQQGKLRNHHQVKALCYSIGFKDYLYET